MSSYLVVGPEGIVGRGDTRQQAIGVARRQAQHTGERLELFQEVGAVYVERRVVVEDCIDETLEDC